MTSKLLGNLHGQRTVKPGFRPFRDFILAPLAITMVILLVAGLGLRFILQDFVIREAEDDAVHISLVLRDHQMRRFTQLSHDKGQLLSIPPEEMPQLDREIRAFLALFDIVKIKVYNTETRIVYSTDPKVINRLNTDNAELTMALNGLPTSEHKSKDAIFDLDDEERYNVEIIETYVPIHGPDEKIIGSFEIYKDVTHKLAMAKRILIRAEIVLSVTVLGVLAILMFVIYRAVRTINSGATALQESEKKYRLLSKELETTVQELSRSNQELQEFIHVASHDLREPTRKILSFGQLLQQSLAGKLNDDELENLNFMIDGSNRMQQMVEALLVYSRVNTKGRAFEKVDLNEIIEQLKSLELAITLEETGGSILVPEPLPVVESDPAQTRQLLQNLISNALKYHREGVLPEVIIRAHSPDNNMVRIEVEDNGIGIKEERYNDVFTMFRRLHPRQDYEGMGIGLAICKRIIERHKGEIGVMSTYGRGSTFWFTLPTAETLQKQSVPVSSSLEA